MDKKSGDDGRLTPIEQIKLDHQMLRVDILHEEDELDWSNDVDPAQVGLTPVYADANGRLWFKVYEDGKLRLRRIWHLS